jgi:poly(hydroxyalkanoate) depolymerase family esterase
MSQLWQRAKAWLARLFRREVPPGRFESGAKFALAGWLSTHPLLWPRREYLVYVPRGWSRWRRAPLLVLCHGCKQTPEEIAQATRIAALADQERWLVLLPRQKREANPWGCWNWFDRRTAEGKGEAAIVAAQIDEVARRYRVDRRRIVVAGMSAGGALAAALGVHHAEHARAVAIHSGLACGAAASPVSAVAVMKHGPDADVLKIAADARVAAPVDALPVPLLAIHGERDNIVDPRNAIALVRQYLRLNGHAAVDAAPSSDPVLPAADHETQETVAGGRVVTTREWRVNGHLVVRYVAVAGLGHAWTGGDPSFPFNDALAPDAAALIVGFARDVALR